MSITVTNNSDGTFTVSCGTESVIVGGASTGSGTGTGTGGSSGGSISSFPPVTASGGGVTASIIMTTKGLRLGRGITPPLEEISAHSVEEISALIRARHQPVNVKIAWATQAPLEIKELSQAFDAHDGAGIRAEIHFPFDPWDKP